MAEPQLKLYTIQVNGIEHVVQLDAADAEAYDAKPYKPTNKAGTASTKG